MPSSIPLNLQLSMAFPIAQLIPRDATGCRGCPASATEMLLYIKRNNNTRPINLLYGVVNIICQQNKRARWRQVYRTIQPDNNTDLRPTSTPPSHKNQRAMDEQCLPSAAESIRAAAQSAFSPGNPLQSVRRQAGGRTQQAGSKRERRKTGEEGAGRTAMMMVTIKGTPCALYVCAREAFAAETGG